jgi:hypothetical protein
MGINNSANGGRPMPARRPISLAGLRGFLAVARSGGFTRAAARLHLT